VFKYIHFSVQLFHTSVQVFRILCSFLFGICTCTSYFEGGTWKTKAQLIAEGADEEDFVIVDLPYSISGNTLTMPWGNDTPSTWTKQ